MGYTKDAREKMLREDARKVAKALGSTLKVTGYRRSDGGVGHSGRWDGGGDREGEYHPGPSVTKGARPTYQDHGDGLLSVVDSNWSNYHSNSFRLFFRVE